MNAFELTEEGIKPYEPPKPCKNLVVVTRCKDCDNRSQFSCPLYQQGKRPDDEWFCADGKQRN